MGMVDVQVEQVVARLQELQCSISGFKPATPSKMVSSTFRSVLSLCLVNYCLRDRSVSIRSVCGTHRTSYFLLRRMPDLLGYSPNKKGNADRRGEGFFIRFDALRAATYAVLILRLFCQSFVNFLDSLLRAHALLGQLRSFYF